MVKRWRTVVWTIGVSALLACSGGPGGVYGTSGAGGGSTVAGGGGGSGGQSGGNCLAAGTLTVTASGTSAYIIDGSSNPALTLCRGSTYQFSIDATGHPFYIKTAQGNGTTNAYETGVTGNGTDSGTLIFTVPASAPATLYYDCSLHPGMTGIIHIIG